MSRLLGGMIFGLHPGGGALGKPRSEWQAGPVHLWDNAQQVGGLGLGEVIMVVQALRLIACVTTAAVGVLALVAPLSVASLTGLSLVGGRGITHVRATLGGLAIALGVAPIVLRHPIAFHMLGMVLVAVALVRLISIFVDGSSVRSNWISFAAEAVFAAILLI